MNEATTSASAIIPSKKFFGRAVDDGVVRYMSVSQVAKANPAEDGGCLRKWWLQYGPPHWPQPERDFQSKGSIEHGHVERYLRTGGRDDAIGKIGRPLKPLMPQPDHRLLIEHGLHDQPKGIDHNGEPEKMHDPFESKLFLSGVPLAGFMDCLIPPEVASLGSIIAPGIVSPNPPNTLEVVDWKFLSDPEKFAKGDDCHDGRGSLLDLSQLVGYGHFGLGKFPGVEHVRLSHGYARTRGAAMAFKRTIVVSADEIRQRWAGQFADVVESAKAVAGFTEEQEDEVPANLDACGSYGGCAYRGKCKAFNNQSARVKLTTSLQRGTNMSLFSKAKAAASGGTTPTAAAPPPPPPASNGTATPAAPPLQAYQGNPYAPSAAALAAATGTPGAIPASKAEQTKVYVLPSGARAIFLTASTVGGALKYSFIPVDASNAPNGTPELLDAHVPVTVWTPTSAPPLPAAAAPPPPAAAAPPPPPAAAKKATKKTTIVDVSASSASAASAATMTTPPPTPNLVAAPGASKTTTIAAESFAGLQGNWLFINSAPDTGAERLEPWILAVADELARKQNLFDIRFTPDEKHPMAFGRWKGALAAAIRAEPPKGIFAVSTGDEFVEVAIMALTPHFGRQIVRRR